MNKKIISVMSVALVVFLCSSFPVFASGSKVRYGNSYSLVSIPNGQDITAYISLTAGYPYVVGSEDFKDTTSTNSGIFYETDAIGYLVLVNDNDQDVKFTGSNDHLLYFFLLPTSNNWRLSSFDYIGGQIAPTSIYDNGLCIFEKINPTIDGDITSIIIPAHSNICCYFKLSYVAQTGNDSTSAPIIPNFNFDSNSVQIYNPGYTCQLGSYHANYNSYIPDIYQSLVDLYLNNQAQLSVLQQILASYQANVPASNNLTNQSSQASSTIDNQHQTESNYFSNSQTAIQDTGIQNFQFNSQELGGLNGLKDDFTAVWTACGSLSRFWIASLTIGLALAIIRHRRMFEK